MIEMIEELRILYFTLWTVIIVCNVLYSMKTINTLFDSNNNDIKKLIKRLFISAVIIVYTTGLFIVMFPKSITKVG